jgi:hypothetical protein
VRNDDIVARPPRRPISWLDDFPRRLRLQAPALVAFPDMKYKRQQRRDGAVHIYSVTLDVPGYEPRRVGIDFHAGSPSFPSVFADGPADRAASPHRFSDRGRRCLCIWYSGDRPQRRWVPDDGLLALLGMVAVHLFKEAYWRETGQWLGDEVPHDDLTTDNAHRRRST